METSDYLDWQNRTFLLLLYPNMFECIDDNLFFINRMIYSKELVVSSDIKDMELRFNIYPLDLLRHQITHRRLNEPLNSLYLLITYDDLGNEISRIGVLELIYNFEIPDKICVDFFDENIIINYQEYEFDKYGNSIGMQYHTYNEIEIRRRHTINSIIK